MLNVYIEEEKKENSIYMNYEVKIIEEKWTGMEALE